VNVVFLDARELPDGHRTVTDVCIVGGGPAGLTIARRLAGSGLSVTLLEGGGERFDPAVQDLYVGEHVGDPPYDLAAARLRYFGGSSNHWQGWCRPLDPIDLEPAGRPTGHRWPIDHGELAAHYPAAHEVIGLPLTDYDAATWETRTGFAALPLGGSDIESTMLQVLPTRFGPTYRDELAASDVSVQLHANVVDLVADERRITSLTVAHLDGRIQTVEAGIVVLATGGIENARLLLSSDSHHRGGVGNRHDLVGRYFMEHPHVDAGHLLPREGQDLTLYDGVGPDGPLPVKGLVVVPEELRREHHVGNFAALFYSRPEPLGHQHAAGLGRAVASDILGVRPGPGHARIELMTEQLPSRHNRVELTNRLDALGQRRCRLTWRLEAADEHTVRRGMELVGAQLGAAGIGPVHSSLHVGRGRVHVYGGSHHLGTARMHEDPRHGVVDRDARVHGLENLYIAGSAVFTTGGFCNPTLTIVALADRLASHLLETS
jgi:choline dehydrogenase-like flavoprotein